MLFYSIFPPIHSRRAAADLRPLLPTLRFSSAAANQRAVSLSDSNFIEPRATAKFLSDYLSDGRHSDVLSLLRRTPPSPGLASYWNKLIKQDDRNALNLFDEMRGLEFMPDAYTYSSVLKACGDLRLLAAGAKAHALALVSGFTHCNVFVGSAAIALYDRCGEHDRALQVFDEMLERGVHNMVSWSSVISIYVKIGESRKALRMFKDMVSRGDAALLPSAVSLVNILPVCASLRSRRRGAEVHAYAITGGLIENVFVGNALMDMYAKCGLIDEAKNLFDRMEVKNVVSWNTLVTGYSRIGKFDDALGLFDRMREKNIELDVFTWSAVIAGYAQRGLGYKALDVFKQMILSGSQPNAVTLVSVLSGCAASGALDSGREIHCYAIKQVLNLEGNDLGYDMKIINGLIDMYAKCKNLKVAHAMFDSIEMKNRSVVTWTALIGGYAQHGEAGDALGLFDRMREENIELDVVTWNALIAGYAQRGLGYEALDVFKKMILSGSQPNAVTLVSVLSGCAASGALDSGRETHGYAIKQVLNLEGNDLGYDMKAINGLIDMYAKCKKLKVAHAMFDSIEMKNRSVVTWTALIGGYAQHGEAGDALRFFTEMLSDGCRMKPNGFTISCALVACARVGALRVGREIHAYALRNRYEEAMIVISNSLIDMYVKSGDVDAARVVFDNISQKNAVSWTSMMMGYGMHGRGEEAVQVFEKMRAAGLPVDGMTFVVLLSSCSHSGINEQGIRYFDNMKKDFGVVPEAEHYGCMVDLLGRAGRLDDALKLINDMPMQPHSAVWMSLLSSCSLHGNVEIGELAVDKLLELKCEGDGFYTLLSNIYASAKQWKDVARIRLLMKRVGIRRPDCSWLQGRNGTVTFYVGDKSYPIAKEIYDLLQDLIYRAKVMGYVVDDEEKDDLLLEHS